jgi:integrase/recombinase XerD
MSARSDESLVDQFQADLKVRNITADDIYVLYAGKFSAFLAERGRTPLQVERDDLKGYLVGLREGGLKPTSINRIFACISQFYAFLVDEELILANPIPSFRRRYLRQYKDSCGSEPRQMLSIQQASMLTNSILSSRDKAILTLLFKTGIREGELSRLDVSDVDLQSMEITLKPTAKRSNRLVFFDHEAEGVLRIWLRARENRKKSADALFPSRESRLSNGEICFVVKKHAQRVGLHNPDSKCLSERFTPHCCRHCWTTWLLDAGMKREYVQWLRGDAIRDAIDIYYHISPEDVKKSYLAHIPQLGI